MRRSLDTDSVRCSQPPTDADLTGGDHDLSVERCCSHDVLDVRDVGRHLKHLVATPLNPNHHTVVPLFFRNRTEDRSAKASTPRRVERILTQVPSRSSSGMLCYTTNHMSERYSLLRFTGIMTFQSRGKLRSNLLKIS